MSNDPAASASNKTVCNGENPTNSGTKASAQDGVSALAKARSGAPLSLSIEVFPPKTPSAKDNLWVSLRDLRDLQPDYVSVTYGAGGSTQQRTVQTVSSIEQDFSMPVVAHLTCVGQSKESVDQTVQQYIESGVRRIVALRGDSPQGQSFQAHPQGYRNSIELIASIARRGDIDVTVGCYPETHPDASSADDDIEQLKRKQDAGASCAISQFFFSADVFLRFVERARAAGVTIPIVPGILPVRSLCALQPMAARCGTVLPNEMVQVLAPLDTPEEQALFTQTSIRLCVELCQSLKEHGVHDFHFYTMNRAGMTNAVWDKLNATGTENRARSEHALYSSAETGQ